MEVVKKLKRFHQVKYGHMGIKEFEYFLNQDEKSWIKQNIPENEKFRLSEWDRYRSKERFEKFAPEKSIAEFEKFLRDEKSWMESNLLKDHIQRIKNEEINELTMFFQRTNR